MVNSKIESGSVIVTRRHQPDATPFYYFTIRIDEGQTIEAEMTAEQFAAALTALMVDRVKIKVKPPPVRRAMARRPADRMLPTP